MLRPLLNKWEAHYFNGHEHDLEHIVEDKSKVNYISTGAVSMPYPFVCCSPSQMLILHAAAWQGKYCCYADTNLKTVPEGSIKFSVSGAGGEDWWGRSPTGFELQSGKPAMACSLAYLLSVTSAGSPIA